MNAEYESTRVSRPLSTVMARPGIFSSGTSSAPRHAVGGQLTVPVARSGEERDVVGRMPVLSHDYGVKGQREKAIHGGDAGDRILAGVSGRNGQASGGEINLVVDNDQGHFELLQSVLGGLEKNDVLNVAGSGDGYYAYDDCCEVQL
eukprot:PDM67612.1 hypothetical protein PRIPAC_45656 [Pristionchus pacificus]